MIDIKKLRDNFEDIESSLNSRGYKLNKTSFQSLDKKRKELQIDVESLQAERKSLSSNFGKLKASGEDTADLKKTIDEKNQELEVKDEELQSLLNEINDLLLDIPNIPHESVPEGKNEEDNVVIEKYGDIKSKNTLDHLEITNHIDTELAAKLAGSRFAVLKGDVAKLQRALITFMLDEAASNGYQEFYLPYIVNKESLLGTGQLPKFEEDQFKISDRLYLSPTAEVQLTNMFRDSVLDEKEVSDTLTARLGNYHKLSYKMSS